MVRTGLFSAFNGSNTRENYRSNAKSYSTNDSHALLFKTYATDNRTCGPVSCRALWNTGILHCMNKKDLLAVAVYRKGAEAVQREL